MIRFYKTSLLGLSLILTVLASSSKAQFKIQYEKYTLANGLEVILHDDKSDPITAVAVFYHVGSNRETKGKTGFAHLFEHMMFQESQHIPQDQFFKKIQSAGGTLNGGTSNDQTIYFEVIPRNALEMALWMEADRMGYLTSTVTQSAFENQQNVVQNEKRQYDNRPYSQTSYMIGKLLYPDNHPYNWQVIGSLEDLANATLRDVHEFHDTWYVPNNATLVVAGDFDKQQTKKWIETYFGEIKGTGKVEAIQPQRVTLPATKRAYYEDNLARSPELNRVYPTVEQFHKDSYALDLLASLLGGSKKSPFYKVIVEEKMLAPSVNLNQNSQEVTGEFTIRIRTNADKNLEDVEKAVEEAFQRFEKEGFTDRDLARVKASTETRFYNQISGILGKSIQLAAYNEFAGSPDFLAQDLKKSLAVTKEDIWQVYHQYIQGKKHVVTSVVPKGKKNLAALGSDLFLIPEESIGKQGVKGKAVDMKVEKIASKIDRSQEPAKGPDPTVTLPKIWKEKLNNGVKVFGIEHKELPLVRFAVSIQGGMVADKKIGTASLLAQSMTEGTRRKTPVELEEAIDELGASINVFADNESIVINANCLAGKFEAVFALVKEILLEPRFDEKEFVRLQRRTLESIRRNEAMPAYIANSVFQKLIYGDGNILSNSAMGTASSVESISVEDLKSYYAENLAPSLADIGIAGDVSSLRAMKNFRALEKEWAAREKRMPAFSGGAVLQTPRIYFVDVPGARQSEVRVGNLAMAYGDPDYFRATVMNYKLGGSFNGILNLILREEKGFTYGARSGFSGTLYPGTFNASTAVQSNATLETVQIIRDEITKYRQGISAEDLQFTREALVKSNALRFETLAALLSMLRNIALYNQPLDYVKVQEEVVKGWSAEEHKALAQKYLDPAKLVYLVVGDAKTQLEPLKKMGFGDPVLLDKNAKPVQR